MHYFLFFMITINGHSSFTSTEFNSKKLCYNKGNELVVNSWGCKLADSCKWDCVPVVGATL